MSGRRLGGLSGAFYSVLGWAVCAYALLHVAIALGLCAWRTRHRRARLEPLDNSRPAPALDAIQGQALTPGERWVHLGLGLVALVLALGLVLWWSTLTE